MKAKKAKKTKSKKDPGSRSEAALPEALLGPVAAVRVFSQRFDEALSFYRDTLNFALLHEGESVAVFGTGNCDLVLEHLDLGDLEVRSLTGRFVGVSFLVPDAFQAYERLQQLGVRFEDLPVRQDWGGTTAHFFDPDGNILTLVSYPKG
ncbi:VOC family protein [Pelagibius sp. Alg239-R121]|uniref:VOC family protein n=1 Tax=Pelagibius sp. Alg239-R121 TaxID=2993448 RepID=UPI0024A6337C|nr:VOC family protein [Pelagibius sp. Alg239-R121]